MPVMDGLEATRLIRSFEKTGNWDEATKAGVEPCDSSSYDQNLEEARRRIPIIAVSTMKLNILTIVNCLACCRICITSLSNAVSFP